LYRFRKDAHENGYATMTRLISLVAVVLALVIAATAGAAPQKRPSLGGLNHPADGSLLGLHELRREGNLVCIVDHTHLNSSAGQPSRKAAEVAAMRAWASFTAWEYGSHWGNPALSANKTMKCSGSNNSYGCDFEARPCRR
jgi:hypothetical protein